MKDKTRPWDELKEEKCPKCKQVMTQNMFYEELYICSCGFSLEKQTKELLVNRFNEPKL